MLEPAFSKHEKIFFFGSINATLLFLGVGIVVLDISNSARFGANFYYVDFYFYACIAVLILFLMIPFIGKTIAGKKVNIPRLIFYVLLLKMIGTIIAEFVDSTYFSFQYPFFAGAFDFFFGYQYLHCFLTNSQCIVIVGTEVVKAYYPPGVAFIYLFLTAINPAQWTFLYRFYMLFFEAGTYYLIYVIAKLPKLNIPEKMRTRGVIFAFFAPSFLTVVEFFGKYDILIIFLTLVGLYFLLTDKPYVSGVIWTFCALAKLYTILWILGFLIHKLKKRQYANLIKYALVCVLTGTVILGIAAIFEGFRFFQVLFQFGFQFQGIYALFMQNVWFFLVYTGLPGTNLIPYILLFVSFTYFTFKWKGELTPDFFMRVTAITLFFYPAVNVEYLEWLMPMICMTMLGSPKKVQVLAVLEITAVFAEESLNFYCIYVGLPVPTILSLTQAPPITLVLWRFVNLGLFLLILTTLIIPERFSKFFPEAEHAATSHSEINVIS